MLSPPASRTPPSSGPDSSASVMSTTAEPPPPPNSIATVPPAFTAPPPPPPTEAFDRARRNTIAHRGCSDSIGSIGKRFNPPFGEYLSRIHEENPGSFFEAPTDVPDNTPKTSHAGASTCSSPTSDRTNLQPTVLNLPQIIELLEQLPPPAASGFSSPLTSVTGESSVGEPLMMATPRRSPSGNSPKPKPTGPLSPLNESRGGVREHSDWANDIVQDVDRDLTRLANLAVDDNKRDPTKSIESHYRFRLNLLLNDKNQKIMYGNVSEVPIPSTAEPGTPSAIARRSASVHANYVTWSEFKEFKDRVHDLNRLVKQLSDMHSHSHKEVNILKTEVSVLKKAISASGNFKASDTMKENDASQII